MIFFKGYEVKENKQIALDLITRQKTFTLDDVELETDIKLNVTFIETQEDLIEAKNWLIFMTNPIGLDIETRGLDPHQHELIMLQFGDKYRQFVIDTRIVDVTSIIPLIVNDDNLIIGQNLKFEYKFFKHNYDVDLVKVKDTMLQEICLYNGYGLRNSLKELAKRYLNYEGDKSLGTQFLTIGDAPFTKDQIIYGAYDVILPILISEQQDIKAKERGVIKTIELEHEYMKVLGDSEYKGLYFDKKAWKALYDEHLPIYIEKKRQLDEYIITHNRFRKFIDNQIDMFYTDPVCKVSWDSPKQVVELFKEFKLCPLEMSNTTKKLTYTVESKAMKASLLTINKDVEQLYKDLILLYLDMKEYAQRVNTFGIKFFKYINPVTGRLHSNFNQIISTGRSSSRAPNLQNIPSDPRYRKCFTAPKGNKIINADFSGQENVVLANKSLDKDLLEFYKKGNSDMHSFIASKIYNLPYKEFTYATEVKDKGLPLSDLGIELLEKRKIAKAAGFAINYGGNGYTISKNLGISAKKGDEVYDAYFKAFPGLRKYFDKTIDATIKRGYIHINDVTGRRFNLINYKKMITLKGNKDKIKEYYKLKGQISRLALNYPIQGTAGDITKYAAIQFRKWILKNNLRDTVFITNIIHDEINVEALTVDSKKVANNLKKSMEKAGKLWCKVVPLLAEAQIKDYWTH